MKKVKQIIKNNILGFILGAVIFGGVGVYAATTISSSSVTYGNTTVSATLDDLISKTKVGTATAAQILSGKTALVQGSTVTGTMTNRGAVTSSLNAGGSYTIPAGYHNGSGKVTANSLASQTSATATAEDIASGKTAYVNGSKITGTASGSKTVFCGSYDANGKFNLSDYGLSDDVDVDNFVFVPTITSQTKYASAAHIGNGYNQDYVYVRGYGTYKPHSFTLADGVVTFTLPKVTGSAYNGPTSSNVSAQVGGNWTVTVAGKIYYIG